MIRKRSTLTTNQLRTHGRPHVLLIDDDPLYRSLVSRQAKDKNIDVTSCASLREVQPTKISRQYDAVIVDYFLDNLMENLKGSDVARIIESTPIILVSSSDRCIEENIPWPTSIRRFINKNDGVKAILDEILEQTSRQGQ